MTIPRTEPGDPIAGNRVVVLPAQLDRAAAAELHALFVAALGAPRVVLDGSAVQRADTAGVQLLCALVLAAAGRGLTLGWTAVSPALVTSVRLLGVEHLLQVSGVRQDGLEWFD